MCPSLNPFLSPPSLCVNPSVSNPLPVRLNETSMSVCPALYSVSSRGCLPLPLLSITLHSSFHPPFPAINHFRSPLVPPPVCPLLHSSLPSCLICLSSPLSTIRSSSSLTLCPLSYLLREGQCSILAALHPPGLGRKINKRPHVPKEF